MFFFLFVSKELGTQLLIFKMGIFWYLSTTGVVGFWGWGKVLGKLVFPFNSMLLFFIYFNVMIF
jgi:hypothetical protein